MQWFSLVYLSLCSIACAAQPLLKTRSAVHPRIADRRWPLAPPSLLTNSRWVLARHPDGAVKASDFLLVKEVVDPSALADGQVLVRVETLSIDAFIRTTLDERAYHGATPIGSTITALGLGVVVASTSCIFKPGDKVAGVLGAQTYASVPTALLTPAPQLPGMPANAVLAELGFTTGLTAWVGMHAVLGPPKRGEVVVVSAAAGAVGCCAAQMAMNRGARVIGIAGGARKVQFLTQELGLQGTVDYKDPAKSVGEQLDELCPDGIDFFFDNVGGATLDAVLARLRPGARVIVCGAVSQYDTAKLNHGQVEGPSNYLALAERGATMSGFNVMQKMHLLPWMIIRVLVSVAAGRLHVPRHTERGIERVPAALALLFNGGHVGKLLVELDDSLAAVPSTSEPDGIYRM
ncbi:hypothetical protein T492DRAFT_631329 [Pavlovales sp. CCMP2436]|nr:hypothetical protein T492DRAFT_631329 [Pavlovales sp. CCMP2436]